MTKFACVDFGASETRYMSHLSTAINFLPNNTVFVGGSDNIDLLPSTDNVESALDVSINKVEKSDFFPCRALIGEMATRYSNTNITPSGMNTKTAQPVNHVSVITAVALTLMDEPEMDTHNVSLYLALPPVEVQSIKERIQEQFKGQYTVVFNKLGGKEVHFKIVDVEPYAESFLAGLAFMFGLDGKRKSIFDKYTKGNLLSIDIGASTTDLAVITDRVYQERTGRTYKLGGNVVRDAVINTIMARFDGYDIPIEEATTVVKEGRLRYGNDYRAAADIVSDAKRVYASKIVQNLNSYFSTIGIPLQSIRAILVSGGGSMSSTYQVNDEALIETVASMTYYITEELHKVCKTVAVEEYDGNPRTANIEGLYLRAKMDLKQKQKK